MGEWHFHTNQTNDARRLVERHHYSASLPDVCTVVGTAHDCGGLFGDFGPAFAACVFGSPPSRWSEDVVELRRLVLHPERQGFPLTQLISKTVKHIRKYTAHDLLVSFADNGEGHHGGIYQASSWDYAGMRAPQMAGVCVDGTVIPRRTAYDSWGTSSPSKLLELGVGVSVTAQYDSGKHLYWKAIRRSGRHKAKRLGLGSLPYPKPDVVSQ